MGYIVKKKCRLKNKLFKITQEGMLSNCSEGQLLMIYIVVLWHVKFASIVPMDKFNIYSLQVINANSPLFDCIHFQFPEIVVM